MAKTAFIKTLFLFKTNRGALMLWNRIILGYGSGTKKNNAAPNVDYLPNIF
jgi:hypothetical protein